MTMIAHILNHANMKSDRLISQRQVGHIADPAFLMLPLAGLAALGAIRDTGIGNQSEMPHAVPLFELHDLIFWQVQGCRPYDQLFGFAHRSLAGHGNPRGKFSSKHHFTHHDIWYRNRNFPH